jgi:hypothetical protein
MSKNQGGNIGDSLAIFLEFTLSGIYIGFPTLSLQAAFCWLCKIASLQLALQYFLQL